MARVRGNFRALLKRLPESVAEEIRAEHVETGRRLLARAYSLVPQKSGALRSGLSFNVTPKTLKLRFGILGKAKNRKLFYGRFQEFGWRPRRNNRARKLRSISAERGSAAYRIATIKRQRARVPGRHFIYNTPRAQIYQRYQKIWGRALHRAASGAGE